MNIPVRLGIVEFIRTGDTGDVGEEHGEAFHDPAGVDDFLSVFASDTDVLLDLLDRPASGSREISLV